MSEEVNKPAPVEAAAAAPAPTTTPAPEVEASTASNAGETGAEKAPAEETPATAAAAAEATDKTGAETKAEDAGADKPGPMIKTTARIDAANHAKNVKSDPKALPETDDPTLIRNQVEYYFGDSNLPRDKFMWETTGGEANRPVSLKTICSFKRMRRFQPYSAVVAALRESTTLDVLDGNQVESKVESKADDGDKAETKTDDGDKAEAKTDDGDKAETKPAGEVEEQHHMLRRKKPYQSSSDRKRKQEAATLYVKGFGDEVATTQFDIEAFFAQHGPVNYIKLRRTPERLFKGSVFAEFPDAEAAKKFLDLAPQWKNHELKIMTKHDYCEEKNQLIREGKLQPSSSSRPFFEGRGDATRGRGRGGNFNKGHGGGGHKSEGGDWKKGGRDGFRGGRGRGRGGRGRGGRGGRGGGDRGRGGRDDRNGQDAAKETAKEAPQERSDNDVKPRINVSDGAKDAGANGKRAREDAGESGAPPAKKVDVSATS